MSDNYYRLVCFIVNICPELLRAFFIQLAKKDAGSSYTSLNAYLNQRKLYIEQLHQRKIIRNDQFSLIFPSHGTGNESDWDVTLLVCLITTLFPGHIQPIEKALKDFRDIRNALQHISNTANVSNTDFNSNWGCLESAATTLAQHVFNTTEQISFKTKIDELKKNCLPNLVDCLRLWHEETVKDTANKIDDLQNEVNGLKSETRQTNSILHSVTVKKPGPAGDRDKNKRFKSVDTILRSLQANFEQTITELPENFSAPDEIMFEIQTKLRDKHHVVVSGCNNSRYFETALAAIKGMGYNTKRCVVMQKSSDWRHIDPDDVDFVLCRDPFGRIAFDENNAKGMAAQFKSIKHTAEDQNGKRIDILIVTDSTILAECKRHYDHDILDDEVNVFEATTEEQPADLTGLAYNNESAVNSTRSEGFCTLRVLTDSFFRRYKDDSLRVDNQVLKAARDIFKSKKVIVLTGTKHCLKSAVAVALASFYSPSQCLLLTKANNAMFINWQKTCLLIIDEFAGKYRYEENEVHEWYRLFDYLCSVITAGKVNIVITCERDKLKRCIDEISSHPLLEHVVEVPDRVTNIKEEGNDGAENHQQHIDTPLNVISLHATNTVGASGSADFAKSVTVRNADVVIPHVSDWTIMSSQLHHDSHWKEPFSEEIHQRHLEAPGSFISMHSRNTAEASGSTNLANSVAVRHADGVIPGVSRDWPIMSEQESESGTVLRDLLTSGEHSKAHTSTSITKSSTSSEFITVTTSYSIKFEGDILKCDIRGCCWLPSGDILLVDRNNKNVKKLDMDYTAVGVCQFSSQPQDVCYIGNNKAVVSLDRTLYIVNVVKMTMIKSVDTYHTCYKLASHGNLIYVCDDYKVYVYDVNNFEQSVFYSTRMFTIRHIAVSVDGFKIYIGFVNGLVTIDSSGKILYTLNHNEIDCGVCVDNEGHVLVCNESSILQVSSCGRQILGEIGELSASFSTMCFDRHRSALVFCKTSKYGVTLLDMKLYIKPPW